MFGAEDLHLAIREFEARVKTHDLTSLEVAIRWLAHHSALSESDAIIVGASKAIQVTRTVELMRRGPLPDVILPIVEHLWDAVRESRGNII